MSFDFDQKIDDEVDKRLKTFFAEGIGKEKTELIDSLLLDLKKIYTDVEESTILSALYDEYILLGSNLGDKSALEDVKRRILLYRDTHKKKASDKKEKEIISGLAQEAIKHKPKSFTNKLSSITDSLKAVFRSDRHLAKDIYKADSDDSIEDRKRHRQILASYYYDVVSKGAAYYSANKAVFEKDTAYIVNHFFIDNPLFRKKTGGKLTGREAVNLFYALVEQYDVAHKQTVLDLKRQLASTAVVKSIDKQEAFNQYVYGEQIRKNYITASRIAVGINKAVLRNRVYIRKKLSEKVPSKGIEQHVKKPSSFIKAPVRYQKLGAAVQYIKDSPWYTSNEGLFYDAFGLHKLIKEIDTIKKTDSVFTNPKVQEAEDKIKYAILMDDFGRRFVRQYIRDERGIVTSTVDYAKEKPKQPKTRIRKEAYDKFFAKEEEKEPDDRYYSGQHKGFFFRDEKEHTYFYEDEKGNVEEVPGITKTIAHFVGGAYDEPFSKVNPVGIQKGKEEFHSAEAQVNGTAIHSLVNKYYRTGRLLPSNNTERKKENLEQALYIIQELERTYPKDQGWEINTEKLISSPVWKKKEEQASERFASSIDIIAINKGMKLVDILDIKTGNTTSLPNKRKVQYQLSAEAYFYLTEHNKYLSKDKKFALRNLSSVSVDRSNKFIPKVSVKNFGYVGDEEIVKLFSLKYKKAPAGSAFERKGELVNLDINPTYIKDVEPFARTTAFELFPLSNPETPRNETLHRKMVTFDLETTGTSRSKFEIQSLSYAVFDMSETEQRAILRDMKEQYFLVSDESYLSQEAQTIHHITNARVLEMYPTTARKIKSSDIEEFMSIAAGNVLTGHNELNFDIPVLRKEYIRLLFEEGYTGKQVAEKVIRFDKQIAETSLFDTFAFYKAAPITKDMEEILRKYNRYSTNPWDFYEGLKNSEIFQSYNRRYWHKQFDPSKLHSSTYDMLLTSVIAQEAVFGRHPDDKVKKRASVILKQLFGRYPLTLFEIGYNGDAYSLHRTTPQYVLSEPEFVLRAGIKYLSENKLKNGMSMGELVKDALEELAWDEDFVKDNYESSSIFSNPIRVIEYNGYTFFYDREAIDKIFPNNLSDEELGRLLYEYAGPEARSGLVGEGAVPKHLLVKGIYDIIDTRSVDTMAGMGNIESLLEKISTQIGVGGADANTRTVTVLRLIEDILTQSGKLTQSHKDLAANLYMHDALTATNVEDFDLAASQVLKQYSSRSKNYKALDERLGSIRTRKFYDKSTRVDELYNALHRAKAPLSLITEYNTDKFTGDHKTFNNLLTRISQAGKLNTVLKEQNLELGEKDWNKVLNSENPYSFLEDKDFIESLGQVLVKDRVKSISRLAESAPFGIEKKDRDRLEELAKKKYTQEDFDKGLEGLSTKLDRLREIEALSRRNPFMSKGDYTDLLAAASGSAEDFADAIQDVTDRMGKATRVFNGFTHSMMSVPFYNPERFFSTAYGQIGGIHNSLRGVIPNFMNTSITKMLTGTTQDYERSWLSTKYGLKKADTVMPIVGSILGAVTGGPNPMSIAVGASLGKGAAALASQFIGLGREEKVEAAGLFFQSRFNKMGAVLTSVIGALNIFAKALKLVSVPILGGVGLGIYHYKKAIANMAGFDTPLTNLTGISYGNYYQDLIRSDQAYGMAKGTTNKIIEGIEFQKQGLFTLGRYDKDKLISAAMLGVLNNAFIPNGKNGAVNYAEMMNTLFTRMNTARNSEKQRMMYLLNMYNPEMARQLQVRTDMANFLSRQSAGSIYKRKDIERFDITDQQRQEFRAVTFFQGNFADSISKSIMKVALGLYKWKGFDFMNAVTGVVGRAGEHFAEGRYNEGFEEIANGLINFMNKIGETWAEVKEKLGVASISDMLVDRAKLIGYKLELVLLDLGDFALDIIEKIQGPAGKLGSLLMEQFSKLFEFVGTLRFDYDLNKLAKGQVGGITPHWGYKTSDYDKNGEFSIDAIFGKINQYKGPEDFFNKTERWYDMETDSFVSWNDLGDNAKALFTKRYASLLFGGESDKILDSFMSDKDKEVMLKASMTGNTQEQWWIAKLLQTMNDTGFKGSIKDFLETPSHLIRGDKKLFGEWQKLFGYTSRAYEPLLDMSSFTSLITPTTEIVRDGIRKGRDSVQNKHDELLLKVQMPDGSKKAIANITGSHIELQNALDYIEIPIQN